MVCNGELKLWFKASSLVKWCSSFSLDETVWVPATWVHWSLKKYFISSGNLKQQFNKIVYENMILANKQIENDLESVSYGMIINW